MSQVFKTGLTIFLMFAFLSLGVGAISASIDSAASEQFTADAASQIENFNFNDDVISQCKANAQSRGYEMNVTKIDSNGDGMSDMAEIITKYDFNIFVNNLTHEQHVVRVYAR